MEIIILYMFHYKHFFSVIKGVRAFSYAFFGAGSGPIHMDNVGCLGSEQVLINCSFTSPLFDYHYEDAGVRCGDRKLHTYSDGDVHRFVL